MRGALSRLLGRLRVLPTPEWADSSDEERRRAWAAFRDPEANETKETRSAKWKVRAMIASFPISLIACTTGLAALSVNSSDAAEDRARAVARLPADGATDFAKIEARDWLLSTSRDVLDVEWRGWQRCSGRSACEIHTVHASLAWDIEALGADDLESVAFLVGDPFDVLVGLDVAVTVGTSPLSIIGITIMDEVVAPNNTPACPVGASAIDTRDKLPRQFLSDVEIWATAWVARDQQALVRHANDPAGRAQDEWRIDGMRYISSSLCVEAVRDADVEAKKIVTVSLQSLRECGVTFSDDVARDEVVIRNLIEMAAHPCGVPLRTEVDLVVNIDGLNSHVVEVGPVGTVT